MRLLIISAPSIGHARSMAPVARALAHRGHDVYWASNATIGYVAGIGAHLINVLPDHLSEDKLEIPAGSPQEIDRWLVEKWFVPLAEAALGPTLAMAKELNPDLVLTDSTAFWGPMVADSLHRPWATYCPGLLLNTPERQVMIREIDWPQEPVNWGKPAVDGHAPWRLERRLNSLRRKWGLPAVDNLGYVSNSLVLCFTSRAFEYGGAGIPIHARCVGPVFGATDDVDPYADHPPKIPSGEDPLVYVTLGNVFAGRDHILDTILEGLKDLSLRVLVARARVKIRKTSSPNASIEYATQPISQAQVLKHASLAICDGDFNTVHESLCHGVPLIAIPLGADQMAVARRIEDLGLGLRLNSAALTPQDVHNAVKSVLTEDSLTERVREVRIEARISNGVARAARLIEDLAKHGSINIPEYERLLETLPERPRFAGRFRLCEIEDDLVALRSYVERYAFHEKSFVEAIRWLWGTLDGKKRVQDVLEDWSGSANLLPVIATLTEKGILEDNIGSERLSQDVRERYADQITLFSHAHAGARSPHASLRGNEFQEKLMRARICVVGTGVLASHVVRNLGLVGIGSVNVVGEGVVDEPLIVRGGWYRNDQLGLPRTRALADQVRELRPDIDIRMHATPAIKDGGPVPGSEDVHLLILAQDTFEAATYAWIDQACHKSRTQWTSIRRNEWNVEIGPAIIPHQTGCFLCFERRRAGTIAATSTAPGGRTPLDAGWFHLAMGPELVVLEALKLLAAFGEALSVDHVLIFNSLAMTLTRHRVLRLPYCPRCSPQPALPPETPWRRLRS